MSSWSLAGDVMVTSSVLSSIRTALRGGHEVKDMNCENCNCHPEPAGVLPEVLTLSEAAALLRVKDHTMYYLLEHGQIKGRRVGKEYRFTRSALLAWLAENAA